MFTELSEDLRAYRHYVYVAFLSVRVADEDSNAIWSAFTQQFTAPPGTEDLPRARRPDYQRLMAVLVRVACTALLVWNVVSWSNVTGPAFGFVLAALAVRYPRVPVVLCLASAAIVFWAGPDLGLLALVRVAMDWVSARASMRVHPSPDRAGRSGARCLRLAERRAFGHHIAEQADWAVDEADDPAWRSARLEERERTRVLLTVDLFRHAKALESSGAAESADSSHSDRSAPSPQGRAGPPSGANISEAAPIERLRDAFTRARANRAEQELRADAVAVLIAGVLAGAISYAHPRAIGAISAQAAAGAGLSDLRMACAVTVATALATAWMRWQRPLGKRWGLVAVVALFSTALLPPLLLAVPVVMTENLVLYLRWARERSPYPGPRLRSLVTARRALAVTDLWFARRHALGSFEELSERELDRLAYRFEALGLRAEAARVNLDLAAKARYRGTYGDAADLIEAARNLDPGCARLAELEEGLLAVATGDVGAARQHLINAATESLEAEDLRSLSRSLSALGSIALRTGESGVEEVLRAARTAALLRPSDHRLILENELAVHEALLSAGRPAEAAEAAEDVISLGSPGAGFVDRPIFQRMARVDEEIPAPDELALYARASLGMGEAAQALGHVEEAHRCYSGVLELVAGVPLPLEAAEAHRRVGLLLEAADPSDLDAFRSMLTAVSILTEERHLLASQSDRARWFARHRAALEAAFRMAVRHDRQQVLLELIELARTQAVPRGSVRSRLGDERQSRFKHLAQDARSEPAPAPVEAAEDDRRMRSSRSVALEAIGELPLVPPPHLVVRGTSAIEALTVRDVSRERRAEVDLAVAAHESGGPDAWWLSYWATENRLYWGLLPPNGLPASGAIRLDPGSEARAALDDLAAALPMLLPGEEPDSDAWWWRLEMSPFFGDTDRSREAELAERLGGSLLPPQLRESLCRSVQEGSRLSLVISPCADLAHVPWCLLGLGEAAPRRDRRLHDAADWRLAPSVALLEVLRQRPAPPASHPVATAVLDPLSDLPAARDIAGILPAHVQVLGGRTWSDDLATVDRFSERMTEVSRASTLVIASHCTGPGDESSGGGLALLDADTDQPYILTPAELLLGSRDRPPPSLPSRVVLAACDSAGVAAIGTGEWLSIGPAALFAGADVVAATQFPIPDSSVVETAIVEAIPSGRTLADIVHSIVQAELDRWRAGGRSTPLEWAAFAVLGRWEHTGEVSS